MGRMQAAWGGKTEPGNFGCIVAGNKLHFHTMWHVEVKSLRLHPGMVSVAGILHQPPVDLAMGLKDRNVKAWRQRFLL